MKQKIFFLAIICGSIFFLSCKNDKKEKEADNKTAPVVKSVFINGDSLHFIDIGKGEPVVFVHGTLGDYRTWGMQLDTFSKQYRIISYSRRYAFPNRQEFNDSADYSVNIHADDLAEFLKTLNTGPVHLVGHSFGAYTALMTTLNHPELVKSLTLGEPPVMSLLLNVPGGDSIVNQFFSNSIIPAGEAFKSGKDEKAISVFTGGVLGDTSFFSKAPAEGRSIMLANTLELKGTVLTNSEFPPVSCDDLKKITVPVLLVQGERSPALFTVAMDEIGKCILNNEKIILSGASHGLELENPEDFNKIVLKFISKH